MKERQSTDSSFSTDGCHLISVTGSYSSDDATQIFKADGSVTSVNPYLDVRNMVYNRFISHLAACFNPEALLKIDIRQKGKKEDEIGKC